MDLFFKIGQDAEFTVKGAGEFHLSGYLEADAGLSDDEDYEDISLDGEGESDEDSIDEDKFKALTQ